MAVPGSPKPQHSMEAQGAGNAWAHPEPGLCPAPGSGFPRNLSETSPASSCPTHRAGRLWRDTWGAFRVPPAPLSHHKEGRGTPKGVRAVWKWQCGPSSAACSMLSSSCPPGKRGRKGGLLLPALWGPGQDCPHPADVTARGSSRCAGCLEGLCLVSCPHGLDGG